MTTADDTVYRVLRLPSTLRTAMKEARESSGQTNAQFLAQVVDRNLPSVVKQLEQIGFGRVAGKVQTARLPFSEEAGTLATLRDASDKVQIPATQLLQICLASALGETPAKATRRRRRKSSQAKGTARRSSTRKPASSGRRRKRAAK